MKKGKKKKSLECSRNIRIASDTLIGVLSTRELIRTKHAAKDALGVNTGIAENGDPSNDILVVDLGEKVDRHSRAKASLSRRFVETEDANIFREDALNASRLE